MPEPKVAPAPSEVILRFLRRNPVWHMRDDILEAVGLPKTVWVRAIRTLLLARKVEMMGIKRWARYRAIRRPRASRPPFPRFGPGQRLP